MIFPFIVNAQSVRICGTYKLAGYYEDDGSVYKDTLIIKKTEEGVVLRGAVNCYLKEDNDLIYREPSLAVRYAGFTEMCFHPKIESQYDRLFNRSVNRVETVLVNISFYVNGKVIVNIMGIEELKCTRITN